MGNAQLGNHQGFLIQTVYMNNFLPWMQQMTSAMTATTLGQTKMIGALFDAREQVESQRALQSLHAQAAKDYTPSGQICKIGSATRNFARTERESDVAELILSERAMNRELGQINTQGARGATADISIRLKNFKTMYCDYRTNNLLLTNDGDYDPDSGLLGICEAPEDLENLNKDVNYVESFLLKRTLDLPLDPSATPTEDEKRLFALSDNLYAHELPPRLTEAQLKTVEGQRLYMGLRALAAKRSVARASFNAQAALRAKGTQDADTDTAYYMTHIFDLMTRDTGVSTPNPADIATSFVSQNPSYLEQLEFLSKRLFQDPHFYINLYEKPANVKRMGVALQAIRLMLEREIQESHTRTEMLMSQILELQAAETQRGLASD